MDSFHGQRNEIQMTHDLRRARWTKPFRLKRDTTMQIQVRLTRDKCSKQIQFCSVPRIFTYAQQVQIACAIREAIELTAGLQKVSARLEATKPAPQPVLNNQ
jgi:hypothetical protein